MHDVYSIFTKTCLIFFFKIKIKNVNIKTKIRRGYFQNTIPKSNQ